jgi:serine protease Do
MQACAAGNVYQIAVVRTDGSRAIGSAVQIAPQRLIASCHTLHSASGVFVMHPEKQFAAALERANFTHDLCLLHVPMLRGNSPARLHSKDLAIGQAAVAFGYGPGFGLNVARGTITALHPYDRGQVLCVSARFAQGASGGGLFDEQGRLIGILTFRARSPELNYAVPMEWVDRLLDEPAAEKLPEASAPFWEDGFAQQPAFLRAARLEYEGAWLNLKELAGDWTAREDDPEAWLALGRARWELRETDAALTALRRATTLEPHSGRAWYWLAVACRAACSAEESAQATSTLERLDPELSERLRGDGPAGGRTQP